MTTFSRSILVLMELVEEMEYDSYVTEISDSVNVDLLLWTRTEGDLVYLESDIL